MPGLDEDAIRVLVERVVREVLAELDTSTTEDEWPEWDEFAAVEPQDEPSPIPRHSVLRTRAQGAIVTPLIEDDEELPYDVSINGASASMPASGFTPNADWLAAQLQRDGYLKAKAPVHALEAWEE